MRYYLKVGIVEETTVALDYEWNPRPWEELFSLWHKKQKPSQPYGCKGFSLVRLQIIALSQSRYCIY